MHAKYNMSRVKYPCTCVSDSAIKLLSEAGLCVGFVFSYFTFLYMYFDKFLMGFQRSVYFAKSCFAR